MMEGKGCTANVLLITNNLLICANAGDSRAVMCERGQAVELSKDHKPDLPEELNRIHKAGGEVMEGRVNGMLAMLSGALAFSCDLSKWDVSRVSRVRGMQSIFFESQAFNADLSGWDVSKAMTMERMFYRATSFKRTL